MTSPVQFHIHDDYDDDNKHLDKNGDDVFRQRQQEQHQKEEEQRCNEQRQSISSANPAEQRSSTTKLAKNTTVPGSLSQFPISILNGTHLPSFFVETLDFMLEKMDEHVHWEPNLCFIDPTMTTTTTAMENTIKRDDESISFVPEQTKDWFYQHNLENVYKVLSWLIKIFSYCSVILLWIVHWNLIILNSLRQRPEVIYLSNCIIQTTMKMMISPVIDFVTQIKYEIQDYVQYHHFILHYILWPPTGEAGDYIDRRDFVPNVKYETIN